MDSEHPVLRGRWILRDQFSEAGVPGDDAICGGLQRIRCDCQRPVPAGQEYSYMGRLQDFIFPAYDVRFIAINDDVDSAKGENDFAVFKMYSTTTTPRIPARKSGQW